MTLLSMIADFNNVVVWMVSICPISDSFSLFSKSLGTFLTAPTIIGIPLTFILYSFFFHQQGPSIYISFRYLTFSLCGPPEGKIH